MKDISLALFGFCLGVLAIWVKDWIERKIQRNRKRAALAALCISELNDFKLTLARIHGFRLAGMSPLFGYSIPTLLFSLLDALIETDLRHVQIYNTMLGNVKRVSLLEQSLHDALSSGKATEENLDKLYKQLEYTLSCLAQNQLKYLRVHAPERLGRVAPDVIDDIEARVEWLRKVSASSSPASALWDGAPSVLESGPAAADGGVARPMDAASQTLAPTARPVHKALSET